MQCDNLSRHPVSAAVYVSAACSFTCITLLLLLSFTTPFINLHLITVPGEGIYRFYM